MAATTAERVILELEERVSGPAAKAEKALERLAKQEARVQAAINRDAARDEQQRIKRLDRQYRAEQAAQKQAQKAAEKQAKAKAEAEKQQSALDGTVSKSAAAMSAAMVAFGVMAAKSIATAYTELFRFAFAAADAEAKVRALNMAAGAASGRMGGGAEIGVIVEQLGRKLPLANEAIGEMARKLSLLGVGGRYLQLATEAAASLESAIPGAGAKITSLVERFQKLRVANLTREDLYGTGLVLQDIAAEVAASTGMSVQQALAAIQQGRIKAEQLSGAMAAAVKRKFGDAIGAQNATLATSWDKLKATVGRMFAGVNLGPLVAAVQNLTRLFSENSETGQAMSRVIAGGFSNAAANIAAIINATVEWGMKFAIVGLQIEEQIYNLQAKFYGIVNTIEGVLGPEMENGGVTSGNKLIDGLVSGIITGMGPVAWAADKVGKTGVRALLNAFKIRSPSRVAVGIGQNVTGTLADTLAAGVPEVAGSLRGLAGAAGAMADAPAAPSTALAVKQGARADRSGGRTVYIERLTVGSVADADSLLAKLRELFEVESLSGPEPEFA